MERALAHPKSNWFFPRNSRLEARLKGLCFKVCEKCGLKSSQRFKKNIRKEPMTAQRKIEELYPRAPRYTIEVGDHQLVRFSGSPQGSRAMHTRVINISESGMAFLVPYLTAPQKGTQIKVEFNAPNTPPIACFAQVVRVETHRLYHPEHKAQVFKLVAVEFVKLHPKQREMIASGLHQKIREKYEEHQRIQRWNQLHWFFVTMGQELKQLFSQLFFFKRATQRVQKEDLPMELDQKYIDT